MELIALYALALVIVVGSAALGLILWAACALSGRLAEEEEE